MSSQVKDSGARNERLRRQAAAAAPEPKVNEPAEAPPVKSAPVPRARKPKES